MLNSIQIENIKQVIILILNEKIVSNFKQDYEGNEDALLMIHLEFYFQIKYKKSNSLLINFTVNLSCKTSRR